jgi:hypothetical protein
MFKEFEVIRLLELSLAKLSAVHMKAVCILFAV